MVRYQGWSCQIEAEGSGEKSGGLGENNSGPEENAHDAYKGCLIYLVNTIRQIMRF